MGEMITKPDANPILIAILNGFFGAAGYFIIGQKKKAMISAVIFIVTSCMMGLSGIWMLITMYDGYLLGQKLASGESVGENENGLDFLNMIFK